MNRERIKIEDVELTLAEIIERYEVEAEMSRYAQKYVDALMVAKKAVTYFSQNGLANKLIELSTDVDKGAFQDLEDEIKRKMKELKNEHLEDV